jgi:hypothetical protein
MPDSPQNADGGALNQDELDALLRQVQGGEETQDAQPERDDAPGTEGAADSDTLKQEDLDTLLTESAPDSVLSDKDPDDVLGDVPPEDARLDLPPQDEDVSSQADVDALMARMKSPTGGPPPRI